HASFPTRRSSDLSFLQAGLPLLINDYLPLAALVREYNAGWVVDSRRGAREAVIEALAHPETWHDKARGAHRLARERFSPSACSRPLLDWLETPGGQPRRFRPAAGAGPTVSRPAPARAGLIARRLLRPVRRMVAGTGVVVITRPDLFPTDHRAAAKIIETARGLAGLERPVAIVTAERSRYWRVTPDDITAHPLPWWLRALAMPKILSHA